MDVIHTYNIFKKRTYTCYVCMHLFSYAYRVRVCFRPWLHIFIVSSIVSEPRERSKLSIYPAPIAENHLHNPTGTRINACLFGRFCTVCFAVNIVNPLNTISWKTHDVFEVCTLCTHVSRMFDNFILSFHFSFSYCINCKSNIAKNNHETTRALRFVRLN